MLAVRLIEGLEMISKLIRKVQETLRESILGVVNGGHRKLEHESWFFVQNIVEQKVQKYLPDVKITVPDDIGNEGVSVGAPTANTNVGGGTQSAYPQQSSHQEMEPPSGQYGGQYEQQHGYNAPPQYQNDQGRQSDSYQQQGHQSYQQPPQYDRREEYSSSHQNYQQHNNETNQSGGGYQQQGNYQYNQSTGGYQQDYRPPY
jgi:hypothetical protein